MQKTRQLNFNECFDISEKDFVEWRENGRFYFRKKPNVDYSWLEFELNLILREETGRFKSFYATDRFVHVLHIQILQALFIKEKDLIALDLALINAKNLVKDVN